jgi:hypothetical protein
MDDVFQLRLRLRLRLRLWLEQLIRTSIDIARQSVLILFSAAMRADAAARAHSVPLLI